MHTLFDVLRSDLDKLVSDWQPKLDATWEEIKEVQEKDLRLSLIIEYNRFRDLLREIDWLRTDDASVHRFSKSIAAIRCELHWNREHESIGDDIMLHINDLEKLLEEDKPNMSVVCSSIKRAINALKNGEEVIPATMRDEIIKKLNQCIIKRNQNMLFPKHGIILQLKKDREWIHCVAIIYHVECANCKNIMEVVGNSDCDVFAPVRCGKCKCYALAEINTPYDRMKRCSVENKACVVQ